MAEKKKKQRFVAVVEDDDGLRAATEDLLQSQGFATRGFSSAEQFLRSRRRAGAGCLILDISLPGMSGVELLRHLRRGGSSVPVICSTAEVDVAGKLRARLLQAGVMEILSKPFDPDKLLELVGAALEMGKLR